MNTDMNLLSERFQLADEQGLCPECGEQMDEVSRLNEGDGAYVWLQCGKGGCAGQWLQKKQRSGPKGMSSVAPRWQEQTIGQARRPGCLTGVEEHTH